MNTATESVTMTDGRPSPLEGCNCLVCRTMRSRQAIDRDLADNYQRYLAGELVSREEDE